MTTITATQESLQAFVTTLIAKAGKAPLTTRPCAARPTTDGSARFLLNEPGIEILDTTGDVLVRVYQDHVGDPAVLVPPDPNTPLGKLVLEMNRRLSNEARSLQIRTRTLLAHDIFAVTILAAGAATAAWEGAAELAAELRRASIQITVSVFQMMMSIRHFTPPAINTEIRNRLNTAEPSSS